MLDETHRADCITHNPVSPGSPLDFEGYKQVYFGFLADYPDLQIAIDDMFAEGDKVAKRWTGTATHEASGNRVEFTGITIYRFADGKVAETW